MQRSDFEKWMRKAIDLALQSRDQGNRPFGALLVHEDRLLLEAIDTVHLDQDPTQHAEIRLASQASQKFSEEILESAFIFCSTEPCVMCSGAIYWSGIRNVVYGCPAEALGTFAGADLVFSCRNIFQRSKHSVNVTGPILDREAIQVHKEFWS